MKVQFNSRCAHEWRRPGGLPAMNHKASHYGTQMRPFERKGLDFHLASCILFGFGDDFLRHEFAEPIGPYHRDRGDHAHDEDRGKSEGDIAKNSCSPAHSNAPWRY